MFKLFGQLRDEFVLKVVHGERDEVIPTDEITELHLTSTPKESWLYRT